MRKEAKSSYENMAAKSKVRCPECNSINWGPTPTWSDTGKRCDKEKHVCFSCGHKFDSEHPWRFDNLNGYLDIEELGFEE